MKFFFKLIILYFVIFNNVNAKSLIGKGDLTLHPKIVDYFLKYLKDSTSTSFVISKNGSYAIYGRCPSGYCSGGKGSMKNMIKKCELNSVGVKCYVFAVSRNSKKTIKWNKINHDFKTPLFNYHDSEIKKTLLDLGFINKTITKTNNKTVKKNEAKKVKKISNEKMKQLQVLKNLFESGALTKEEYNIAKKKVMNE